MRVVILWNVFVVVVIGVVMLLLLWVFVEFVVGLGTVSPAWREGHDSIELPTSLCDGSDVFLVLLSSTTAIGHSRAQL